MNRTILITGSSRGLGFSLAECFAQAGWRVIATRLTQSDQHRELLSRYPQQVFDLKMDVSDARSVASAVSEVQERFEHVDVLVNNAAILPTNGRGAIGGLNFDQGLQMFNVNALGPLRVTEALMPALDRGSKKWIVNISSEAGSVGDCWRKDEYFYCMSKSALNMQSAILRNELKERGYTVIAVHPGWMRTEMGGQDADIDPSEAALGVRELIERKSLELDSIYLDYRGRLMRW